ncbi:NAD(P)/FAD-dependent oxidoreductase [Antrihabitans sp. YC2-6]|uniref:NAD(P)/FAD-dependent oxidoreductase n=1 Tax=Antrihabitans sp. YC2-6 TaxID=2799498 RepID=UPI0018F7C7FB|nr:NAD(P)/FAD-dependent oxidoreductase [Antrihabitans sp. YC2-6]MBJ8344301.1 NAD(P)/FAD-dependent oxidoreductase [Antrihabitans sp. YC2-6]
MASGNEGEHADAIVVGARCAGSATAVALARAGRRVVVLDSARFPSDTLSTHLLWTSGLAELQELGALDRVLANGAPRLRTALAAGSGHTITARFPALDGIDYALCVRRTGLDAALVDTARQAGADVREGCRVDQVVWNAGRVAGVSYTDSVGAQRELRASLVVGADGRRSTIARLVGVAEPYRSTPSGRECYFAYWEDSRHEWRDIAAQWRVGSLLGTAFPCDDGLVLCLVQPPPDSTTQHRPGRSLAIYRESIAGLPELSARLDGCRMVGKVRAATNLASYFRRSSGPGWALPGDSGHFKDPVTAQGIRDALRYGRLLGEATAHALDDPEALDAATHRWERARERDCLEVYQWTNRLARGESMSPLEIELYRGAQRDGALARATLEVFCRTRKPSRIASPATLAARALLHAPGSRLSVLANLGVELAQAASQLFERLRSRLSSLPELPAPPTFTHNEEIAHDHTA